MTEIWLSGAENPAHHALLAVESVAKVAINVGSLHRTYKKDFTGLNLDPAIDVEWVAWTDSASTLEDLLYVINLIGKLPTYVFGSDEWKDHAGYLKLWDGLSEFPVLDLPKGLVIPDSAFKVPALRRKVANGRKRTSIFGVITGRSEHLEPFDIVVGTGWWQVGARGELQVWDADAKKLWRHNVRDRAEKSVTHVKAIQQLGVSHEAILNEDTESLLTLSVRSWLAYSDHLVANGLRSRPAATESVSASDVAKVSGEGGFPEIIPAIRPQDRRPKLPSMEVEHKPVLNEEGAITNLIPLIRSSGDSIRQCDTCYLNQACPQFRPNMSCAYSLTVEIRTKEQREVLQSTLVEIQTQRFFQARLGEEVMGDGLDPLTGKELDRLFKMMEYIDNGQDAGAFKLMIQGSGAAGVAAASPGGVLTSIFGAAAGDNSRKSVQATNTVVPELDIVDAEEVG